MNHKLEVDDDNYQSYPDNNNYPGEEGFPNDSDDMARIFDQKITKE
jgi:hypothetical protein